MNQIEDRLRETFRADAQTVRPQTIRPFVSPGTRPVRPGRPAGDRPRGRLVVPMAAAAAVALVAVGTSVVLPRILANHDPGHHAPPSGIAAGYPGGRMPGGPPPKFFVAITIRSSRSATPTNLSVIDAKTGKITGRIGLPEAHQYFQAVAPLGNDRTFVAAASAPGCHTRLYTFTISGRGKPVTLATLAVPVLPGTPLRGGSLAASSDGTMIGFDTRKCSKLNQSPNPVLGQVGVISLASRHVTMWPYRFPAMPDSLSLSANGSLLEMVSNPSGGKPEYTTGRNAAWVVRTSAAPGPLEQRYRKVFGAPAWPTAAVLSPTGRRTWAFQPRYARPAPHWLVMLTVHQTATGKLLSTWYIVPQRKQLWNPSLSASVSGRYLLVFQFNNGVEKLDLATGKLTKVPGNNAYLPADVAW